MRNVRKILDTTAGSQGSPKRSCAAHGREAQGSIANRRTMKRKRLEDRGLNGPKTRLMGQNCSTSSAMIGPVI